MTTMLKRKKGMDRPPPMMGGTKRRLQVNWRWWAGVTLLVAAAAVAGFVLGTHLAV